MKSMAILLAIGLLTTSGALAQGNDLHVGNTVYAVNLPFCTTLADAENVASEARKTGNALAAFMRNVNCKSGHGNVMLVKQMDSFPDSSSSGGYRYIVEVKAANETLYGLLEEPLQPATADLSI